MIASRSLKARLTWWFSAALLALYGTAATLGWLYARNTGRQYALLALKQEVEQAAAYIAESGRFDAAEFEHAEEEPIPLWLRALERGAVVKASPGAPGVPVLDPPPDETISTETVTEGGTPYMVVHHRVGGNRGDIAVEAVGSLVPLRNREQALGAGLVLAGVLMIPLAALGGRRLATRALAPLDRLVGSIRRLDPAAAGARLDVAGEVVQEVDVLTAAFNDLLGRLQANVDTMRRFTADASHEIRNPLTVLRTGLEIALRRERTPEQYRTLLHENLAEIERLHAVLEGLLAMTRSTPGRPFALRRERVDMREVVGRTLDGFATVASARGVRLEAALDDAGPVSGDPSLLRLVVFNLVDNAIKHGPAGAPVEIVLDRDGEDVRLVVADRGAGVPGEVRERLFERFNRPAEGEAGVGGLGLSVVRWVATLHNGTVRLVEPAPDRPGARFEVRLPCAERGAGRPAAPAVQESP